MSKRKSDLKYCESDYTKWHYWETKGISNEFVYLRCSQCCKWKRNKIKYVIGGK